MASKSNRSPNALVGNRGKGNLLQLVRPAAAPPEPLKEWRVATRDEWLAFWQSAVAGQVDRDADLPALVELFTLQNEIRQVRDERVELRRMVRRLWREQPLMTGSMGQERSNPLVSQLLTRLGQLESSLNWHLTQANRLREDFGMGPLKRVRLGWSIAEGMGAAERVRSILNAGLEAGEGDDE
jgi:hypothetical protein